MPVGIAAEMAARAGIAAEMAARAIAASEVDTLRLFVAERNRLGHEKVGA